MKIIHILHHSISPFEGQYPDRDPLHYDTGLPMTFARAIKARYPDIQHECWRPERTATETVRWTASDGLAHCVFPSFYWRYNLELSLAMVRAVRSAAGQSNTCFFVHGSYNLHACLLAPILQRAPAILQSHGGFPAQAQFRISRHRTLRYAYLPMAPLERATLPRYPQMYTISTEELGYVRRYLPGSRAVFSPTGLDFDHFSPGDKMAARAACGIPEDQQVLLYVGRLAPEKGLPYLLDAFAPVAGRFPKAMLYIVGSGPLRESLEKQCQDNGIETRVRFVGHVSKGLPNWYRAADVTVVPSYLEWFGMVTAESMACGTPVIATEAGGSLDIVREFECGLLVPPRNAEALAEAMTTVLSGAYDAEPNIERARARFDWNTKLKHAIEFFRSRL